MPFYRNKPFEHAWHRCWSLGVLMTWCTHVGLLGGTKCPMPSESCPKATMMPGHSRTTAIGLGEKGNTCFTETLLSDDLCVLPFILSRTSCTRSCTPCLLGGFFHIRLLSITMQWFELLWGHPFPLPPMSLVGISLMKLLSGQSISSCALQITNP
jgi:hypothetical protein